MDDVTMAPAAPSEKVRALGRLLGTWAVSGGASGTVTYEWLPGGHFLLQRVTLAQDGQQHTGIEVIGHLNPFDGEPSEDVKARFYDDAGNTLDYTYEVDGDTLWIWGGDKGSPAYYEGRFSADGTRVEGAWTYPGGYGYESTMTRLS